MVLRIWGPLTHQLSVNFSTGLPKLPESSTIPSGPSALKQRIINGEIVEIGTHPHQVSLQYELVPGLWFPICGGSVIGTEFVLTAAHCVDYK